MKLENKIHAMKLIKFGTPLYCCTILYSKFQFVHLKELMDILPLKLQICEIKNSIRIHSSKSQLNI